MQPQVLELFSSLPICVTIKCVPVPAFLDVPGLSYGGADGPGGAGA